MGQRAEDLDISRVIQSSTGVAVVGLDHQILWANPALCSMLGYGRSELFELFFEDVTHPEDASIDAHLARQTLDGALNSYQIIKRYVQKSGRLMPARVYMRVIRDLLGHPLYFQAVIDPLEAVQGLRQWSSMMCIAFGETNAIRRQFVM